MSLGPAKGKDFATGLGPYLVTMDELTERTTKTPKGNTFDLGMRAFVNGEQLSKGNVADMTFTFAQILERVSYGVDVFPGLSDKVRTAKLDLPAPPSGTLTN